MKWNSTELWDKDKQWLNATLDANGDVEMSGETGGKRPAEGPPANEPTPKKAAEATNQIVVHKPSRNWMNEAAQAGGDEAPTEAARLQGTGPGGNQVSKETPISPYPSLSYGLQETHTTILPWTGWVSVCNLDKEQPVQLGIRMNTPWDMVIATLSASAATGTVPTKGFYRDPLRWDGTASGETYPINLAAHGATGTSERPVWRDVWAKMYDYYTVLGCEWEVIAHNPTEYHTAQELAAGTAAPAVLVPHKRNSDVAIAVQYDTYSDTATSTGNVMPLTTYEETRSFKNIQWYGVKSMDTTIMRGRYTPGQAKRNIVNDGDVKTWTSTNVTSPVLPTPKEILTVNFFKGPLANQIIIS